MSIPKFLCFTPVGALRAIAALHLIFYSVASGFAVSYSLGRLAFIPFLVTVACAYLLWDSFQETPKHNRIVLALLLSELFVLSTSAGGFGCAVLTKPLGHFVFPKDASIEVVDHESPATAQAEKEQLLA
ncbi:hypothetical protein DSO57_1001395 [Entomophthora muscae]|uniref:Uncharacterized protein n=1 Tax=Entomophthora muscae TaxID=34485 RepID=A0ACC2TKB4_9FUNG|nr:hypothetical protein DSO57_1001395 [Entomophthora muscae]